MQMRWAVGWLPKTINLVFSLLLTFFGLLFVTFLIGRVIPIDPVLAVVGDRALPDVYDRVRQELALDQPLYYQFWLYLTKVLHGDFGTVGDHRKPVHRRPHPLLSRRRSNWRPWRPCWASLIGVPMGVLAAKLSGALARSPDPRARPRRLFGAGVLARPRRPPGVLQMARLGRRTGRLDVFYEDIVDPVTGMHADRRRHRRRVGHLLQRVSAI